MSDLMGSVLSAPVRADLPPVARPQRRSRLGRVTATTGASAGGGHSCPLKMATSTETSLPTPPPSSLLNRWGVVFRSLAVHDSLRPPWRDVQWALRRLDDRGLVRAQDASWRVQRRAVRPPTGRGTAGPGAQGASMTLPAVGDTGAVSVGRSLWGRSPLAKSRSVPHAAGQLSWLGARVRRGLGRAASGS